MSPGRLLTTVAAALLIAAACGDSEPAAPSGDATLPPATAPLAAASGTVVPEPAASTAAPATTAAAPASGEVVEVAPGLSFGIDMGTATAAVSLSEVEAMELTGDELLPFDAVDVRFDDCAEIYPFNYAVRFSIDERVAFDYPVELVVTMYSLLDEQGFPLDPQLVTVSGPGTFTGIVGTGFFAERIMLPSGGWILEGIEETVGDDCYAVETSFRYATDPDTTAAMVQYRGSCAVPELFDTLLVDGDWTVVGAASALVDRDGTMGVVSAIDELVDVLEWYDNVMPRDPAELEAVRELYG